MFTCLLNIPEGFKFPIHDIKFFRKPVAFLKARYPAPKFVNPDGAAILFPEGSNVQLFNHCFGNMDTFEDKHMDYEKDYCESLGASRASGGFFYFFMLFFLNPQNTQAISRTTIEANTNIS